jgi:hypothetical protein
VHAIAALLSASLSQALGMLIFNDCNSLDLRIRLEQVRKFEFKDLTG